MVVLFVVVAGLAFIWAGAKYQMVYGSVIGSLPPQIPSRYAFPVYALGSSTPLPLQAEYVKSLWGMSVGCLSVSLSFFPLQEIGAGCVALGWFCWSVIYSIKARKNYMENCRRALEEDRLGEPRQQEPGV